MREKKWMVSIAVLVLAIIMMTLGLTSKAVNASDGIEREKSVAYITISEGDTLWNIACDYYTTEYKDVNALIKEIKDTNHIGDNVYIGQKIIVPHYIERAVF